MKKRLAIILLMVIVVLAMSFAACEDVHVHELEHVDAKAATCTDAGTEEYWQCKGCKKLFADAQGATEIASPKAVSALGHTITHHDKVDATCTEAGIKEYWSCSVCEKNFADDKGATALTDLVITAIEHDWGEWSLTTPATCSAKGVETRVCAHDSTHTETRDVQIDANAHDFGEVTYTWAADYSTCTATRTCSRDASHVETETVKSVATITQQSSCTAVELTKYVATFQNSAFAEQTKADIQTDGKGEHNYTEFVKYVTEPTCTEKGSATYKCSGCTATTNKDVDELGHDYVNHPAVAAKCTADGNDEYHTCSRCSVIFDASKNVISAIPTIDALDHDYGEVTYTWAADHSTCTATRTCSHDASHVETEKVNSVATIMQDASCTADELTKYVATFTNSAFAAQTKENVNTGNALGHSYDEGSNFTATHGTWSCTKCDHTEQRVVWGQTITVNGQQVYTHVDNNQVGRYGALELDTDKNAFYHSGSGVREFYSNTKNTTGNYIYKAVVNTVRISGDTNLVAVVGFSITSGPITIDIKSAWWEINNLCINIAGNEIKVTNFSHSLHSVSDSSTLTITVKRVGNALYIYDVNNTLAVVLDAEGVHAQDGHTLADITTDGLTKINALLPQFFSAGVENVCGPLAIGSDRARVDFNISYTEMYNVTGKVTLPADVTADITNTRIVVESNGVYDTYTNVVNAQGEYSLVLPAGTVNVTFTNPAILGASLKDVTVSATNTTIADVQLTSSSASSSSVIINGMEIKMGADEADSSNVAVTQGATKEVIVANSVYGGEAKYNVSMAGNGYQGLLSAGITDGNSIMRVSMRNGYINKFEFEYCLVYATKEGNHVSNYRTYMISASFLPSYNYGRTFTNSGDAPALANAEDLTFTFLKKADGSLELYYGEHLLITINANGFYLAEGITCSNRTNTDGRLDDKVLNGATYYSKPEAAFVTVGREYAVWGHVDGMSADVTYSIKASVEPVTVTTEE